MTTTKEERTLRVAQMRAHLAQEGGVPNPEKEALLDRFIEGTATLADVFDHAHEYVTTAKEREDLRLAIKKNSSIFQHRLEQYKAGIQAYEEEKKQKNIQRRGMSAKERERHEALDFARANVELSGGKISEEHWQQALRCTNGEITMDEYLGTSGQQEGNDR